MNYTINNSNAAFVGANKDFDPVPFENFLLLYWFNEQSSAKYGVPILVTFNLKFIAPRAELVINPLAFANDTLRPTNKWPPFPFGVWTLRKK